MKEFHQNRSFEYNNRLSQIVLFSIMALAYSLFVFSAREYANFYWYPWLLFSRLFCLCLAVLLLFLCVFKKVRNLKVDTFYLTFCLFVQSSHGVLEPSTSVDFYGYTGVLFLVAALSVKGSFLSWIKTFLPIQTLFVVVPLFFKSDIYFSSIGTFVDTFSLPIVGLILGVVVARLNTGKFELLVENLRLNEQMLQEKKVKLEESERLQYLISGELERAKKKISDDSVKTAYAEIARQVAHDIRSPLTALDIAIGDAAQIPQNRKDLIRKASQRIHDIANNLLDQAKKTDLDYSREMENLKEYPQLISDVVTSIVSEKRVQFRDGIEVDISFSMDREAFGLFSKFDRIEMSRILSNIINNSYEAIDESGEIVLELKRHENYILLSINDTGRGIPSGISKNLGRKGFSYGKSKYGSGSGLGLFHAVTNLESWGGWLDVDSVEGKGTRVSLFLPIADQPDWFFPLIQLAKDTNIIIFDDDLAVHEIWKERFFRSGMERTSALFFTSSVQEFKTVVENNKEGKNIYLCDFEISGHKESGLDLIEKMEIQKNSVLVSGRVSDKEVLNRCIQLRVKCLPKELIQFIPIKIE